MTFSPSGILAVLLVMLSFESYSKGVSPVRPVQKEQLEKLRNYETQVERLYNDLTEKAQNILPPLKALNIAVMTIDDLVEVQAILAQFYALDSKLASLPKKLRRPLSQQDFSALEKEITTLEHLIIKL